MVGFLNNYGLYTACIDPNSHWWLPSFPEKLPVWDSSSLLLIVTNVVMKKSVGVVWRSTGSILAHSHIELQVYFTQRTASRLSWGQVGKMGTETFIQVNLKRSNEENNKKLCVRTFVKTLCLNRQNWQPESHTPVWVVNCSKRKDYTPAPAAKLRLSWG